MSADNIDRQGALCFGGAWSGKLDLPDSVMEAADRTLVRMVPDAEERETFRAMLGLVNLSVAALAGQDSGATGAGSNEPAQAHA